MKLERIAIIVRFFTIFSLALIIGLNIFKVYTYEQIRPILLGTTITYSIAYIIILYLKRKRK